MARIDEIRKNRKCKRLSRGATKQEIRDAHRVKMAAKVIVREKLHEQFSEDWAEYKAWLASQKEETTRTGRSMELEQIS